MWVGGIMSKFDSSRPKLITWTDPESIYLLSLLSEIAQLA